MADGVQQQVGEVEEIMSLLDEAMEKCIMIDRTTTNDSYGAPQTVWQEGAEFDAAIVYNSSIEARMASVEGVTALYTITTKKIVNLQYHDVFRRVRDGKIFRVTSDGDDLKTPGSATLNMRQVTGEEFTIG